MVVAGAGSDPGVVVRRATADEWRERRALRLEMLTDTPIAFTDTLESAADYSDDIWRAQADRAATPENCTAVAVVRGRWVGTMSVFVDARGDANLVTVYVSPEWRGPSRGVADRLLDEIELWVRRATVAERLILAVHEDNLRAQSFYRRRGFDVTGRTLRYPLDPTKREIEFARRLPPSQKPDAAG